MSSPSLKDLYPPLFIDVGTENIKYSQSILSTYKLVSQIEANKNQTDTPSQSQPQHQMEIINSNTIFDYKNFINSIPMNEIYNFESETINPIDFKYPFLTIDFNYTFSNEPIFNGLFKFEDSINSIFSAIGEYNYSSKVDYFSDEQFSDTPLIITQNSLPHNLISKQVTSLFSKCFEELNAPFVLICSLAMLELFSHNIDTGIVVDIGESKTSITPIKKGFAIYDLAISNTFFSGRTMTSLAYQMKGDSTFELNKDKFSISFEDYVKKKKEKTQSSFFDIESPYSGLKYFFSYPWIFREQYSEEFLESNIELKDKISMYTESSKKQAEKRKKAKKGSDEWTSKKVDYITILRMIEDVFGKDKFGNFSLANLIVDKIREFVKVEGVKSDVDVVLCGGVMNIENLGEILTEDIKKLRKSCTVHLPPEKFDTGLSFYKGANYLSKLENLEGIMVSRQEYHEVGGENLCYNYI